MSTADVLVVDDEADIRELIQEILTDEGYEVTVSASAAEARSPDCRPSSILRRSAMRSSPDPLSSEATRLR